MRVYPARAYNFQDLTGQKFHLLTALHLVKKPEWPKRSYWYCQCDCGKHTTVDRAHLKEGHTKSCGCHCMAINSEIHRTHGQTKTPEYKAWCRMKNRCYNPKCDMYYTYGGRGITVCERWINSFENFLADMGKIPEGLSLDRIDVDLNYEPGNCKWSTVGEQANNKTNSRKITFRGETFTIFQWARKIGISPRRLWARLNEGWSEERALTEPLRQPYGV